MKISTIWLSALLAGTVEEANTLPMGDSSTPVELRCRSLRRIEQRVFAIADPESTEYREFLPPREAFALADAIGLFDAHLTPGKYHDSSKVAFNNVKPSPVSDTVAWGDARLRIKRTSRATKREAGCGADDSVTPKCIEEAYKITHRPDRSDVKFGIIATEAATFKPEDVTDFLEHNRPEASGAQYEVHVDNADLPRGNIEAQFETALDTQTFLGTAWPAQGILYDFGGFFGPDPGKPWSGIIEFWKKIILEDNPPSVVSISESIAEDMMDQEYAEDLCALMAVVSTRGVSIVVSSGDNGPNGDTADGTHSRVFEAEFPATCPFVTSVGGTTNLEHETAATMSTIPDLESRYYTASGGGFSDIFHQRAWQRPVVQAYIKNQVPLTYYNVSGFNATGRGVPDVAAFSTNMPVSVNGGTIDIGGTSASTPLFGAIVALLNDYEAKNNHPPLGWLNPWLYSLRSDDAALFDIVDGGNSKGACHTSSGCNLDEVLGYDVAPGWDPVTGLGSPRFPGLIASLDNNSEKFETCEEAT